MSTAFNEDFAARADRLRERADAPTPESWRPESPQSGGHHPDTLIGVLVRYEDNSVTFDGERRPCKIAILRDVDTGDERSVWLIQTVLIDEFEKQQPLPGELVCVKYRGKRPPKSGGKPYHSFTVVVEREPGGLTDPAVERTDAKGVDEPAAARHGFGESPAGHPAGEAEAPEQPKRFCDRCGFAERDGHDDDCPNDIPF